LAKELESSLVHLRKCERQWMAERESLHRKLQVAQRVGNIGQPALGDKAFRPSGEARMQRQLQKLNVRNGL